MSHRSERRGGGAGSRTRVREAFRWTSTARSSCLSSPYEHRHEQRLAWFGAACLACAGRTACARYPSLLTPLPRDPGIPPEGRSRSELLRDGRVVVRVSVRTVKWSNPVPPSQPSSPRRSRFAPFGWESESRSRTQVRQSTDGVGRPLDEQSIGA